MDHFIFPATIATVGMVGLVGTSSTAVVGMDTAADISQQFAVFGPFAQLFVATLLMCVTGIVWWARMTERRLVAHRNRNDELLKELIERSREIERVAMQKDEVIERLVRQLSKEGTSS